MTFVTQGSSTIYIPPFTTSTNLGPLTTATSFPNDCLASLYDMGTFGLGWPWTLQTQGCALRTCCPSGNDYTEGWAWMTNYYSPGVCPKQYRTCSPPPSPTALSLTAGENIAFCCPTNYDCPDTTPGNIFWACASILSTSTDVVVINNIFDQKTVSTRAFTLQSGMAYSYQVAYPIQIRWKPGDFASTTPAPQTVTVSVLSGSESASATSLQLPSTTSTAESSSSLSTGAKAGVGVGASFGGLAVFGTVLFLLFWRRKKRQQSVQQRASSQNPPGDDVGGQGYNISAKAQAQQIIPLASATPELAGAKLCGHCGTAVTTPFCTQCGKEDMPSRPKIYTDVVARHEMDTVARHGMDTVARHEMDTVARHEMDTR